MTDPLPHRSTHPRIISGRLHNMNIDVVKPVELFVAERAAAHVEPAALLHVACENQDRGLDIDLNRHSVPHRPDCFDLVFGYVAVQDSPKVGLFVDYWNGRSMTGLGRTVINPSPSTPR